jgi:hypothetical protein
MSGVWAALAWTAPGPHREQTDAVERPHRGEAPVGRGGRARDRHPSPLGVLALRGHDAAGAAGEVPREGHGHPDHRADPPAEVDRRGQQRAAGGHGGDGHRRGVARRGAAAAVRVRGRGQGERKQRDGPSSCEQAAQVRGDAVARIVHA